MAALEYWIWLSASGLSSRAKTLLLDAYEVPERIFFADETELDGFPNLSDRDRELLKRRDPSLASRVLDACEEQDLRVITLKDAAYPVSLRSIYAPPVVLYVKGSMPALDLDPAIAVIGTRRASPYGLKMGRDIAWQIARSGGIVVSGLTSGIDAAAARGALQAGGRCIGVLGCAHELEKSTLAQDVASSGALVSEYAPGSRTQRYYYRERNRVTAGLSAGVVIVEAPEKSGALLFAEEALEQGKDIFAVPANADSPNSQGTLSLIRDGARLVTNGWDVMSEYDARYPGRLRHPGRETAPPEGETDAARALSPAEPDKPKAKQAEEQKRLPAMDKLNEAQQAIVRAAAASASCIDEIIEATQLPAARVLAEITMLQIKGVLRREAGMKIVLNTEK